MLKKIAMTAALAVLLAACGKTESEAITFRDRNLLAGQLNAGVVDATNTFGLALAQRVIAEKPGSNVSLSPISVMQALAMTMNGASGGTKEAMARTLRLEGMPMDELNEGERSLTRLLEDAGPGIKLSVANSLWLQQGWPFRSSYKDAVSKSYAAELQERNLPAPAVRKEINKWVSKKTGGKIPTIVDDPVSASTKLMLINALYFNAAWTNPFKAENTKDGTFSSADGTKRQVGMMHQEGRFEYDEENEYQALRLPYGDGQMGMLIVLPRPDADRKALMNKLFTDPAWWERRFESYGGDLALPKFHVDATLGLEEALSAMGMENAFDKHKADFSEMADSSGEPLYINRVLHKTQVTVSEKGTEAAAATVVEMKAGSAPPNGRFTMTVDRPFWFAIQDLQTNALLFVGAVEKL
ncbi:serpin family protein [Paenibacillus sp. MBLB4367]|uniref:serpin family protein n=1 Tax=Paenibacillus sp. MBLB4367 TaxID=3384767 RepID=UPI003907F26D